MAADRRVRGFVSLCLAMALAGCGTAGLTVITVSPATQALTVAGEHAQFTAIGLYHSGTSSKDITALVAWKSSDVAVATISATGLATAVSPGSTTVTATMEGASGVVTGSAVITVADFIGPTLGSLTIIPDSQTVLALNETGQFIAVGSYGGSGGVTDLTNLVTWISSDTTVATVSATGLATGHNAGTATITAIAKGSDGTILTATSTFTASVGGPNLPALTVYKVGANGLTGLVTAPAPGTAAPLVINCGSGAACVGSFTTGSVVTLTAAPAAASTFGGWSANCVPVPGVPTQCQITITGNDTVGAIFN